jgi:hypothetical protein
LKLQGILAFHGVDLPDFGMFMKIRSAIRQAKLLALPFAPLRGGASKPISLQIVSPFS